MNVIVKPITPFKFHHNAIYVLGQIGNHTNNLLVKPTGYYTIG